MLLKLFFVVGGSYGEEKSNSCLLCGGVELVFCEWVDVVDVSLLVVLSVSNICGNIIGKYFVNVTVGIRFSF